MAQFGQRLIGGLNWIKLKVKVLNWMKVKLDDWIES